MGVQWTCTSYQCAYVQSTHSAMLRIWRSSGEIKQKCDRNTERESMKESERGKGKKERQRERMREREREKRQRERVREGAKTERE